MGKPWKWSDKWERRRHLSWTTSWFSDVPLPIHGVVLPLREQIRPTTVNQPSYSKWFNFFNFHFFVIPLNVFRIYLSSTFSPLLTPHLLVSSPLNPKHSSSLFYNPLGPLSASLIGIFIGYHSLSRGNLPRATQLKKTTLPLPVTAICLWLLS